MAPFLTCCIKAVLLQKSAEKGLDQRKPNCVSFAMKYQLDGPPVSIKRFYVASTLKAIAESVLQKICS